MSTCGNSLNAARLRRTFGAKESTAPHYVQFGTAFGVDHFCTAMTQSGNIPNAAEYYRYGRLIKLTRHFSDQITTNDQCSVGFPKYLILESTKHISHIKSRYNFPENLAPIQSTIVCKLHLRRPRSCLDMVMTSESKHFTIHRRRR